MGAAFLCGHCGIDAATVSESTSYIAGWLSALQNDTRMVVLAAVLAQKAQIPSSMSVRRAWRPRPRPRVARAKLGNSGSMTKGTAACGADSRTRLRLLRAEPKPP